MAVPWYRDVELWRILGFGAVVFVLPAVSILLVRNILRSYWRERKTRRQQLAGFLVITPPANPPTVDK
jgi:hypothetical protein